MSKPHINDMYIFMIAKHDVGAYKALGLVCRILKELNNGK